MPENIFPHGEPPAAAQPADDDVLDFLVAYYGFPSRAEMESSKYATWDQDIRNEVKLIQSWATLKNVHDRTAASEREPTGWYCACGHPNGINLAVCACCGRAPGGDNPVTTIYRTDQAVAPAAALSPTGDALSVEFQRGWDAGVKERFRPPTEEPTFMEMQQALVTLGVFVAFGKASDGLWKAYYAPTVGESAALSPSEEPKLSDLAAWLDRFRGALERNQENADLYMQEICGMKVWASILREASAPLSPAAQEPAFGSASWPYAPNELCPKCGVVLPCHAHQIPHPRAGELLPSLSPAAQEKNHENSRSIEGRATPESTATSREGARVNEAAAHGHRDSEPNGGRAVRPGVEHAGTTNRLQPDAGQSSVVGLSPAPAPLKELGTDLAWWVRRVVETFRADEAAGYRSKSRTYAIEMLEKGLEVSALSPQPPTEERK